MAEFERLALDPLIPPARVLPREPEDGLFFCGRSPPRNKFEESVADRVQHRRVLGGPVDLQAVAPRSAVSCEAGDALGMVAAEGVSGVVRL